MRIDMNNIFNEVSIKNVNAIKADLSLSADDSAMKRIRKNVLKNVKKEQNDKRIIFRRLTAVAAAVCVVLTSAVAVNYNSKLKSKVISDNTNTVTAAEQKLSFSIMQVYASDEQVEITENKVETETPFFQIKRTYGTWHQADELINKQSKSHGNYIAYRYYEVGEYDDARDGSGYIVSMLYGNYFDIKGDNITSVEMACAKRGWITVFFSENPGFDDDYLEMNKSGNCSGGKSIKLEKKDLERPHKIMWNTDAETDELFASKDFKYSDLNDTITVTVTFDKNGNDTQEKAYIDLSFDNEGIMHTVIRAS